LSDALLACAQECVLLLVQVQITVDLLEKLAGLKPKHSAKQQQLQQLHKQQQLQQQQLLRCALLLHGGPETRA
jgi:hypothetical protein